MSSTENRKKDHLTLCATGDVAYREKTTLLEQVEIVHRATTQLSLDAIDIGTTLAGKELAAPLWIGAMTGGADGTDTFNRELAAIASQLGIGFCLGSIKPLLRDKSRKKDFDVRKDAAGIPLMANIGATEISARGPEPVLEAARSIGANGIGVHLNPLMELIQPGGDTDFGGILDGIAALASSAGEDMIVFVKETGAGLSWQDGQNLKETGIRTVEVAGAGGTSWTGVEASRSSGRDARLGRQLWDWGIPTAVSTAWMVDCELEVIASGGVRTGLDVARCLAMGAAIAGIATPIAAAMDRGGAPAAKELLEDVIAGLRYVMLACGASDIESLRRVPRVLGPDLARWIETGWSSR